MASSNQIKFIVASLFATLGSATAFVPSLAQNIVIAAPEKDSRNVVINFDIPWTNSYGPEYVETVRETGSFERHQVQSIRTPTGISCTFLVPEMKHGESKIFRISNGLSRGIRPPNVTVNETPNKDIEIKLHRRKFTTYDTHTGPNKPYFNPIFGPGDSLMTRKYPFETVPGETNDHPHHRGLWFTHGAVNGEDYWSEVGTKAKTVHTEAKGLVSGWVYGQFVGKTDWINGAGVKIAEDIRKITVYNLSDGAMMDFDIAFTAIGGPVTFGDTKEGSLGIRLADSMRATGGDGQIEMSTGVKGKDTWGKNAAWVDYYGSVSGKTVGVAILDNPANLRFPSTWHVRDYGLFANNPFGLHDFNNDKAHPKLGDFTLAEGKTQNFRYRLYFHTKGTTEANVAETWNGYAFPPQVTVKK